MNSKKFADKLMPFLEKYNQYTDREKSIAHYGLEAMYMLFTKVILIFLISLLLGIAKQFLIFFLFYGLIRSYSGGMHFEHSLSCTIASIIILIGGTYLCIYTNMDIGYRIILAGISISSFALYSPADTAKKPIIRENRRINSKIISSLIAYLYLLIIIFTKNTFIINVCTYSLIIQTLLILPLTYKIFKKPYNNYIIYGKYK